MKIKKIRYENFRNFKDKGCVECSTDGKVTIIYGVNGSGKTTFHQLFQWIIYGMVRFNKTASDKMYNLEFESRLGIDEQFHVWGEIEFEHAGEDYVMTREWIFQKSLFDGSRCLKRAFWITKKTKEKDWVRLNNPEEVVEQLLPSGLKNYFFFDGESMITDLKVKGKDSASSLKEALYLMLDLSVYDKASTYIGNTELKTTALGMLFMSKAGMGTSSELITYGQKYENAQNSRDALQESMDKYSTEIDSLQDRIQIISEQIGGAKSQKDYELQRQECKNLREFYLRSAKEQYVHFGEELISVFPKLMISKVVEKASKKIKSQADGTKLIHGVTKPLVDALLKEDVCLCGNPITDKEREHLKQLYFLLPPLGYDSLYQNFVDMAARWGKEYNREKLEHYITSAIECLELARHQDEKIAKLDTQMRENKQYEDLVVERRKAEDRIKELNSLRDKCSGELAKAKLLVNKLKREIDRLSSTAEINKVIDRKIHIMETVKKHFEDYLEEKSKLYSRKLEASIQQLLDKMLAAKRRVSVGQDFSLRVLDSFDDESKSEGQFATVSFAYIGGIFKLLREEKILANKEYPLVLDAPFSKLGDTPRQKVIETIPEYAPQIILLSKDNLQDCFEGGKIGRVYTIISNEEQNIARIEEGFNGNNF